MPQENEARRTTRYARQPGHGRPTPPPAPARCGPPVQRGRGAGRPCEWPGKHLTFVYPSLGHGPHPPIIAVAVTIALARRDEHPSPVFERILAELVRPARSRARPGTRVRAPCFAALQQQPDGAADASHPSVYRDAPWVRCKRRRCGVRRAGSSWRCCCCPRLARDEPRAAAQGVDCEY